MFIEPAGSCREARGGAVTQLGGARDKSKDIN